MLMGRPKHEEVYIMRYTKLMQSVGVRLAERVVQLIRHFYSAPELQILGYIIMFLHDEGLTSEHHQLVEGLICCVQSHTMKYNHELAFEISQKDIGIPSYCLS